MLLAASAIAIAAGRPAGGGGEPSWTMPPEKQAYLDRQVQAQASAAALMQSLGVTKEADPRIIPPDPSGAVLIDPQFAAGGGIVIQSGEGPPGVPAAIVNRWFEKRTDGAFVVVYAGSDTAAPAVGLVYVSFGLGMYGVSRFDAPGRHGALEVIGAVGEVLTLRAADGTELEFDASVPGFK